MPAGLHWIILTWLQLNRKKTIMKTTELFSMIHGNGEWADGINNGDIHMEKLTLDAVNQQKAMLEGLGLSGRFRFESMGLFMRKEVRRMVNSISQADIDAGADNDPFEQVYTVWTAA